jgi:hypothetical protein
MSNIQEIEVQIADLEKLVQAEASMDERILSNIAKHYGTLEKESPSEALPKETIRRIEGATKILQLNASEMQVIDRNIHAARLINPCYLPAHSPTSRCAYTATICNQWMWKTGTATTSNTCNTSAELNPKATANGYGTQGVSHAIVKAYAWFVVTPAYPAAAFVTINPRVDVHGFYIGHSGPYPPRVKLRLVAKGYQYGYSWGQTSEVVVNETGDSMGRVDETRFLNFQMPVGADPFAVLVVAILSVRAKGAGSWAVGDFATGNGNKISIPYVNTWD